METQNFTEDSVPPQTDGQRIEDDTEEVIPASQSQTQDDTTNKRKHVTDSDTEIEENDTKRQRNVPDEDTSCNAKEADAENTE